MSLAKDLLNSDKTLPEAYADMVGALRGLHRSDTTLIKSGLILAEYVQESADRGPDIMGNNDLHKAMGRINDLVAVLRELEATPRSRNEKRRQDAELKRKNKELELRYADKPDEETPGGGTLAELRSITGGRDA